MTTLSVVIPALNEEQGIRQIIERVLAVEGPLRGTGVQNLELLVVDDGSTDRTAEIVASIEGVRLICHDGNRGYGAALKTGFSEAVGEIIGFLDADGTYPPEHFPLLCQEVLGGADLVIGSRMSGADSSMPITRRIGNVFFASLLSLVGRTRVSDSASGMRIFKREILDRIYPLPDGLNLTPVMSTRAIHEDISMVEVPIPYSERLGRSKLSVVRDGSLFLQSMIWTVLTYNPVRILGFLGLLGVGVASLIVTGLAAARLQGITTLGPWGVAAVHAALVASVVGVNLFSLGTTFNYLISLFNKRPVRQGLFGRPIFKKPLDHHFGWMGIVGIVLGVILASVSFYLSLQSWELNRLWLYLVGSAILILMGLQLSTYWLLVRVLEEISQRELLIKEATSQV